MAILSIKIKIGDREYPMKVEENEEEAVRHAGKLLGEKMKNFREQFGIEDKQDLLAMVAFDCLVQSMKSENAKSTVETQVSDRIAYLNAVISKSLSDT